MKTETTGVDYTKKYRCDSCNEKEADCWVSNAGTHGGRFHLCVDCYIKRNKK